MENKVNGNLPEELLHEILVKLPVKDLSRSKCVSKEWYAIIESPSFVDRHFGHESNKESLLFQKSEIDSDTPYAFTLYQDEDGPSRVEESTFLAQIPNSDRLLALLGPSNGVFCTVSDSGPLVVLFNPATREFKELPPISYNDPSRLVFGFGLDPSTRDYKVVVFEKCGMPPFYIFVYSLSSNSWKRIEAVDTFRQLGYVTTIGYHPFLNGLYHWLVLMIDHCRVGILAFDMRSESFDVIQVPECLRYRERGLQLAAYGDSLAVLSYSVGESVDLWVMGRDGTWSRTFTVGPFVGLEWPLFVWKTNVMFFEGVATGVNRCDLSTNRVRAIIPIVEPVHLSGVFSYKESLVSIK